MDQPQKKRGRPRKYANEAERKVAAKARRAEKKAAPLGRVKVPKGRMSKVPKKALPAIPKPAKGKRGKLTLEEKRARQREYARRYREKKKAAPLGKVKVPKGRMSKVPKNPLPLIPASQVYFPGM